MSQTLFDATLAVARNLTDVIDGVATDGDTTYLTDTNFYDPPPDDTYNYGTIWFRSGNNSGKSTVITDFTQSNPIFSFDAQAGACAAGDKYSVADKEYPRFVLIEAVNKALREIGGLVDKDTSLTTVAQQEAYNLPSGVYNIKRVEIATSTTAPYYYRPHMHWEEKDGQIIFQTIREPSYTGLTMRLWYVVPPTDLSADTDTIDDHYHIDRIAWEGAKAALEWRLGRVGLEDKAVVARLEYATRMARKMAVQHKIPTMHKDFTPRGW